MQEDYKRRDNCRLCNSKNLELVMSLAPTPPGDAYVSSKELSQQQSLYPLDLFFCKDCTLAQIVDVVNPEILYKKYIYNTSISLGSPEHFARYASEICDFVKPEKDSLVIDIGSNDGTLLRNFKNRGMKVLGIDPASEIAKAATQSGIETLPEFFTSELARRIRTKYGQAKIVTANNVTANIDEFPEFIEGIKKILSPNGVYVFDTGYGSDLVKNDLIDVIYHEHISFFTVNSLEPFFRNIGMRLVDAKRTPIKRGSLRGVVKLEGGDYKVSPAVGELRDMERRDRIDKPDTFQAFASRMQETKKSLQTLLSEIKSSGKTIAGYGASIGVTTMLYHFDIGKFMDFLVDDNPVRHGSYSPGYHIPVVSREILNEKRPDYAVLLAWQYKDPIVQKNQEYLDKGGRFILPLPKIQIIGK